GFPLGLHAQTTQQSRRGAARGRQPGDPLRARRRGPGAAHPGRAPDGLQGPRPRRQGGVDLRVRADARGAPRVRDGPPRRRPARPPGLLDHHRRRPRSHGGRQPRRPRRRGAVDRPRDRAAVRAVDEPAHRPAARVPLLLRAQGHVRALRQRIRRLPRRLRDDGRALRSGHAGPDPEDPPLPDHPGGVGLLARADRLAGRDDGRGGEDLRARPRASAHHRRSRRDRLHRGSGRAPQSARGL
ncbi:MAG: hypothetical protein AVDCRST_MAG38-2577, partial [uncultured Solirubrobacteraceae bacterium]